MAIATALLPQHPKHVLADLALHEDRLAETTKALARLLRCNVTLVGLCALDEAIAIDFEALLHSCFRLEFVTHRAHKVRLKRNRKDKGRARK